MDLIFFALYDCKRFVGFMAVATYKHMAYLFFLAIDRHFRGAGYGSMALKMLKSLYPCCQCVVDFEMVDECAENNKQRIKMRSFYLNNGFYPTGHFLSYLGVDYEIFCMDDHFDLDTFKKLMSQLKIDGFHPIYFQKDII